MSSIGRLQQALYGNPPSSEFKPERNGVIAAFSELKNNLEAGIAAAALSGTDLAAAMLLVVPLMETAQAAQTASEASAVYALQSRDAANAVVASVPSAVAEQLNGAVATATAEAVAARNLTYAARDQAQMSVSSISGTDNFYPTQAAGEAAVTNGVFTTVDGSNNLIYVKRVLGVSTPITPGAFATLTGEQTLSNKKFSGSTYFFTAGERISMTSDNAPLIGGTRAFLHVRNRGAAPTGLLTESYWEGSTANPYTNNDCSLWEVYNKTLSNSANRSWAVSASNHKNSIAYGVYDGGTRVGAIGWAVSVHDPANGYIHAGTLAWMRGLHGTAGFQGSGTPGTAVVEKAWGVHGQVLRESVGATILDGRAGCFEADEGVGTVVDNYAVYASAAGGTNFNYSFFGNKGRLWNLDPIVTGENKRQSGQVSARVATNAFEFGNPDPGGYGSNLGATAASAWPFLAFNAEADGTGNTFRTRGKQAFVMLNNLADGALAFARLTNVNAAGQAVSVMGRFSTDGRFILAESPVIPVRTIEVANENGIAGEICFDGENIYVCVATDSWKQASLTDITA